MATEKLDIMQTIKDGIQFGLKNFLPLLLTVVLYIITIWIPYLNVGTTIGLYKLIIGIGRGETINPTAIFNKENFANIGGFFLLMGLVCVGCIVAAFFFIIPLYVISIAWGFAIYFLIDKKVSPLKALQLSYDSTFGNKWRIFFVEFISSFAISIVGSILTAIPKVGFFLAIIAMIVGAAILVAIEGVMYDFFSKRADAILGGKPAVGISADEAIDEVKTEA